MKKLKNFKDIKVQKDEGSYTLRQIFSVLFLSAVMVFLSAGAVFGVSENIPQIVQDSIVNVNTESSVDETVVIDSESYSDEDISANLESTENENLNAINASKYDNVVSISDNYGYFASGEDHFDINWTSPKSLSEGADKDRKSIVRYAYVSADGKQLIPLPAFQLETVEQDWCNRTIDYLSDWVYTNSVFDVRYYEESFNFDNKKFAFSDCLVSQYISDSEADVLSELKSGTQISKCTFCYTNYSCTSTDWYGKNDLATESSSWTTLSDISSSSDTTIFVIFKDVTNYTINDYDFTCSWTSGNNSYNGYVQYLYANGEPTTSNLIKMTPPFAADIKTATGSTNAFTMSNYAGRCVYENVEVEEGRFERLPCVYNCAYVSLGPDPAKTPVGYVYEENTSGWRKVYAIACYSSSGNMAWWYKTSSTDTWKKMQATDESKYYQGNGNATQTITYWTGEGHTGSSTTVSNVKMHCNISLIYDYSSISVYPTEDTSGQIDINMFDYCTWNGCGSNAPYYNGGFNKSDSAQGFHTFNFGHGRASDLPTKYDINIWLPDIGGRGSSDHHVNTEIWTNVLGDLDGTSANKTNFPMLNTRKSIGSGYTAITEKEDLRYLVDPDTKSSYRKDYTGLNHLFYKENGYYTFDAAQHFAQLRKAQDKPNTDTISFGSQDKDFIMYKNANVELNPWNQGVYFMPFDDKDNADELNYDWHFGLSFETNFIQPENGEVELENDENAQPMTFKFSGDDDVYVYIDDVLVLDLGGIHGAFDDDNMAEINFKTGEVKQPGITDDSTISTDLLTLYQNAVLDRQSFDKKFEWNGKTFKDFSQHNLKMYYFERGQATGNCLIQFNLQTVPKSPIIVEKHIDKSEIDDEIIYEGNFYYRADVHKSDAAEGVWETFGLTPIGTDEEGQDIYPTYDVYEYNEAGETVLVRANQTVEREDTTAIDYGLFYLEDNQYAVLNGYSVNDKFKVAEYDPLKTIQGHGGGIYDFDVLWSVGVLEPGSTEYKPATVTFDGVTYWYGTENLTIGSADTNKVIFKNKPQADSFIDLRIKKMGDTTDDSDIYIGLNGSGPASFDPYTKRDDSTPLVKNYEVFNSEGQSQGIKTPDDGVITLKKGEYAVIEDVQMRSPVTAIAQHSANITTDQKYQVIEWDGLTDWSPGLMVNPYPAAQTAYETQATDEIPHTLYYSAEIPAVNFSAETQDVDKYSQINFWVKSDEPVPTALTIFKYPELWTFLLAAILVLLAAGPLSIIHRYRSYRRSRSLPTLNLHTTFFNI